MLNREKKISDLTVGELEEILEKFADKIVYGLYWKQQVTTMPTTYPSVLNPGPKPFEVWCENKGEING